jgi:hypothetical protein
MSRTVIVVLASHRHETIDLAKDIVETKPYPNIATQTTMPHKANAAQAKVRLICKAQLTSPKHLED